MSLFATIPNDQFDTTDHISNGAANYTGTYAECDEWCDTQPTGAYRIIEINDTTWRNGSDDDVRESAARVEAARLELDAAMRRARTKGQSLRHIADIARVCRIDPLCVPTMCSSEV